MDIPEEDYLQISGIQHFAFCRRQWALIHIENQWADNLRTLEGDFLHEKAHDDAFSETRAGVVTVRALPVSSRELGISGQCDVVELHPDPEGVALSGRRGRFSPVPVEYKRGKPKIDDCDRLQLCAQAMCLEEMRACRIPIGYLFYGQTRRREEVALDESLRERVRRMVAGMRAMFARQYTPKVKTGAFCRSCSLQEACVPKLNKPRSASAYIQSRMGDEA